MVVSIRILAIIFFGVSIVLIRPAESQAQDALVLQAESMPFKASGQLSNNDSAWAIDENGSITQPVMLTKGKYRLQVVARGTSVGDAWPEMQLKIDGIAVGPKVAVDSTDWSTYSVEEQLTNGAGSVSVELTNAYFDQETNRYRSLEIDKVIIEKLSNNKKSVSWRLTVILMGRVDPVQHAEIPIQEAISFIEGRTRLVFDVQYVTSYSPHDYTPYRFGPDNDRDGVEDNVAYLMMGWNVSKSIIDSLPVSSSYLFLYTMDGLLPLHAGSSLGVKYGIIKGGKPRPYSTVPVDQPWYVNEPVDGFRSHAAQILTHEIINTIQGRLEAPPYNCSPLTATWGLPSGQFESERLLKLNDACYEKLNKNTQ
jgi:hypothetical protein